MPLKGITDKSRNHPNHRLININNCLQYDIHYCYAYYST